MLWFPALALSSLAAPARAATHLTGLTVGADGARLALDAPAAYRAFRLSEPERYVVDLEDSELALPELSWPGAGPVRRVRAGTTPSGALRIVFDLDRPLSADARTAAGAVIVSFAPARPAPPLAPEPAGQDEPAPADIRDALAPLAVPVPLPAAVTRPSLPPGGPRLLGLSARPEGAEIQLDREVEPAIFLAEDPPRLVVDLPGVRLGRLAPLQTAAGGVVQGARAGAFKGGADPVTRVVLDLAHAAPYSVDRRGGRITISFGAAAPAAARASRTRDYRGWIVDAAGRPLSGVFLVAFSLPDEGSLEAPRWSETLYVDARGGRFSSVLGRFKPLPPDALDPGIPLDAAPMPGVDWRVVPR